MIVASVANGHGARPQQVSRGRTSACGVPGSAGLAQIVSGWSGCRLSSRRISRSAGAPGPSQLASGVGLATRCRRCCDPIFGVLQIHILVEDAADDGNFFRQSFDQRHPLVLDSLSLPRASTCNGSRFSSKNNRFRAIAMLCSAILTQSCHSLSECSRLY